ncbi:hypothetical protein [Rhodopseudomonas sp. BAL398]|uniref:hypothetical protein n=1 Tax=Rhodopseudomonas sp. BAL398 TaxID=3034676 RepID=UPI0023E34A4F|nr:hypothetical protein [Rhodopseudomonas sp. BAL398]MDF3811611.1 hypothetical protein [Rhodopseudomonas sp. BAL398]WOK16384.1 hypothetical protein RBJ75_19775 [Rhodopseudomonas sp. BAL398]
MMRRLLQPLWFILAVAFLIEAWFWDHLEPVVARIVAQIPLRQLKSWLTLRIERLSPRLALTVFLVPLLPLYPLKLFALALLARGQMIGGLAIFGFAQIVGLGVIAFIFDVTKPKLLQLRWFAATYRFIIRMRLKAHDYVAPIMATIRTRIRDTLGATGAGWGARTLRLMQRFRRRVQQSR